jgi:hypothetical protein
MVRSVLVFASDSSGNEGTEGWRKSLGTWIEHEQSRALTAAVTASCALLESLFKAYLRSEGVNLPSDQSVLPLWKAVRDRLNLNPAVMQTVGWLMLIAGLGTACKQQGPDDYEKRLHCLTLAERTLRDKRTWLRPRS